RLRPPSARHAGAASEVSRVRKTKSAPRRHPDLNRRERREQRFSFPSPFSLFAPVPSSSARTLVLNRSCQTRFPGAAFIVGIDWRFQAEHKQIVTDGFRKWPVQV